MRAVVFPTAVCGATLHFSNVDDPRQQELWVFHGVIPTLSTDIGTALISENCLAESRMKSRGLRHAVP
jgi:hypothetical protein